MGRPKLWFENGNNRFVHRSSSYYLVRTGDDGGWILTNRSNPDDGSIIFTWSPRKRNPPFTEANKKIRFLENDSSASNVLVNNTSDDDTVDTPREYRSNYYGLEFEEIVESEESEV